MMHWLLTWLNYISTRPSLIALTCVAIVGLIVYGRLTARRQQAGK